MEVKGKIIKDLGEKSGTSQAGNPWKKHEYVLETVEARPRQIHFDFFGERADQYPLQQGDDVTLSFDIESREYQGRWYTSIRGWKAEKTGAPMVSEPSSYPSYHNDGASVPPPSPEVFNPGSDDSDNEDLPF